MIIAMMLAYLNRIGRRDHFRDMFVGVGAAVLIATAGGPWPTKRSAATTGHGCRRCQRPSFCGSGPLSVTQVAGVARGVLIAAFVIMAGVRS
jgi:hypothetical protein